MKVTLVHNIVVPYRTPLFEEIAKRCELTVLFCNQKAADRKWGTDQSNAKFAYSYLRKRAFGPFVFNPTLLWTLIRQRTDAYVIIDNEENIFSNLLITWYARLTRKPYVLWSGHIPIGNGTIHPMSFHASLMHKQPFKSIYTGLTDGLNQNLYNHAASFLAYSHMSERYLIQHGAKKSRITVGTQAMSPSLLPTPTKPSSAKHKRLQLLYIGYYRPEKGIDILIKATQKLPTDKIELDIHGDGPERGNLERLIGKTKNIHLHGYVHDPTDRANLIADADLFILPTYFDPWAHVITESLYYGTPVIVTSSAGISEAIINGKNGFVIKPGDVDGLANRLQELIDDPKKLEGMRAYTSQKENVEQICDVPANADNFIKAINEAIHA